MQKVSRIFYSPTTIVFFLLCPGLVRNQRNSKKTFFKLFFTCLLTIYVRWDINLNNYSILHSFMIKITFD